MKYSERIAQSQKISNTNDFKIYGSKKIKRLHIPGGGESALKLEQYFTRVNVKVFNATFNNITVNSWRSVLLEGETEVPRENHRPATSH